LLAKQPGFSLHAATVCEARQRNKLEKLCRYITRPAIANERLSINAPGQIVYKFKQPFRDGTTHVVLDPPDFIARLAALVPRPTLLIAARSRRATVTRSATRGSPPPKSPGLTFTSPGSGRLFFPCPSK
jgi:hypothetical protein